MWRKWAEVLRAQLTEQGLVRAGPIIFSCIGAGFIGFAMALARRSLEPTVARMEIISFGYAVGMFFILAGWVTWQLGAMRRRMDWLTNHALWSRNRLTAYGLHLAPEVRAEHEERPSTHWPWGAHHTEMLGHLEAAARKWWVNYDPQSPDTAPTNEIVSGWLIEERGVSKDKAKAIASILRVDGLRTGPR